MRGDNESEAEWLARKVVNLRIFDDDLHRMNRSILDIGGDILVVSQFTLAAEIRGNRPSYSKAAAPQAARQLCGHFSNALADYGLRVAEGVFGADLQVCLVNDGPVTIWLDSTA